MASKNARRAIVLTDIAVRYLATPPGLTAGPALLLWHMVSVLPPGGAHLSITDLAETLSMSRVHATNAMQLLLKAGLIVRGPKQGLLYLYQLNPAYFHVL